MGSRIEERMREKRLARRGAEKARAPSSPASATAPGPTVEPAADAVIFLDGMGTLNGHAARMAGGDDAVDRDMCAIVNLVVARTGARIVVSSSWRFEAGCRRRMLEGGLADAFHADWSTGPWRDLPGRNRRGEEIQAWLDAHPEVTRWVILDDDMGMLRHQLRRHVRTDHAKGLRPLHGMFAIDILLDAGEATPG